VQRERRPWFSIRVRSARDHRAGYIELFFDLVFVFALTQVTAVAVDRSSLQGSASALLVLWMLWRAWGQITWALGATDPDQRFVELSVFLATAVAFMLAVSVHDAFGETGLAFAIAYAALRLQGLGLSVSITAGAGAAARSPMWRWTQFSVVLVVVGGVVEGPSRVWLWVAAVIVDLIGEYRQARARSGIRQEVAHLAERYALFVLLALGETLIVTGRSVVDETEAETVGLAVSAAAAVSVTCLLWVLYFAWWQGSVEARVSATTSAAARARTARRVYGLLHFLLVAGVLGMAAGVEEMLLSPDRPVAAGPRALVAAGLILFLGSTVMVWWLTDRRILLARLGVGAVGATALLAVPLPPAWELLIVITTLAIPVLLERLRPPSGTPSADSTPATPTPNAQN
jgi:low temperature requirement protein LtrA